MHSNTKKKIALRIARGLAVRAAIGAITGGVGFLAWEAFEAFEVAELITHLPDLFQAGADFFTLTEEAESVVTAISSTPETAESVVAGTSVFENIGEVSTATDSVVKVPVEGAPNLADFPIKLNPGVVAASFSLVKVDFYLEKLDVNLAQKTKEKIKKLLNLDDVKNLRELNSRIKSEKEPRLRKQLKKEASKNISHMLGDERLHKSLMGLSLALLVSVNSSVVNDYLRSSPDLISSFGDGRNDRVEEITQELQKSKHYQKFFKKLNIEIPNRLKNVVTQAILDEMEKPQADSEAEIARLKALLQAQGINPDNSPEGKS